MVIKNRFHSTQGSITVEAALILPIIIGVFILGFSLMYLSYCHAKIQNRLNELCIEFGYSSYLLHELEVVDKIQDIYIENSEQKVTVDEARHFVETLRPMLQTIKTDSFLNKDDHDSILDEEYINNGSSELSDNSAIESEFSTLTKYIDTFQSALTMSSNLPSTIRCESLYFLMRAWGEAFFKPQLQAYCDQENINTIVSIEHCELFLENDTGRITVNYFIKMPFTFGIFQKVRLSNSGYIHIFSGSSELLQQRVDDLEMSDYGADNLTDVSNVEDKADSGKEESENQEENQENQENRKKVYVTESGIRYHTDQYCFHINVIAAPMILGDNPKKKPCEICSKHTEIKLYMVVYSTEGSDIYHIQNRCRTIYHYVRSISEKEAIVKGYTPCLTCSKKNLLGY